MHASPLFRGCLIAIVASGGALAGCGLDQTELQVRVIDSATGGPIAGATVEVGGYRRVGTNMLGLARMLLRPGAYDVQVSAPRYTTKASTITIFSGQAATATVPLDPGTPQPAPSTSPDPGQTPAPGASVAPGPKPSPAPSTPASDQTITLFGRITDPTGARLPNVTVYVESDFGVPFGQPATTSAVGEYRLVAKAPKGTTLRVSAMADGYHTCTRYVAATGTWRLDFTGAFALKRVVTEPDTPPFETANGRVEDTMGRPLKWGVVKVESDGVRYPFKETALVMDGHYELTVPTRLPLRFTASAPNHRSVTFSTTINLAADRQVDFTGYRALDPTPILEGE